MARLAGIELTASRCALVDLDMPGRHGGGAPARIRAFRAVGWSPDNPAALTAVLRTLRQSNLMPARAVVAVWGAGLSSRHLALPSADDARMRVLALADAGGEPPPAESTTAVLLDRVADWRSRAVREASIVTANAAFLRSRLALVARAGFVIEAAITPPIALASLGRLLAPAADDLVDAYVAVNAEATAVAVVRRGVLLLGREIPLPFAAARPRSAAEPRTVSGEASEYVRRLAPELKRSFLSVKLQSRDDVARVFLCGEFPDLRALTAPLMQALNVDVATLDAAQGLVPAAGPALDAEIRERAGELRIAWAAAADRGHSVDLQPRVPAGGERARWWPSAALFAAGVVVVAAAVYASRVLAPREDAGELRALRTRVASLESRLRAREQPPGQAAGPAPVAGVPAPPAPSAGQRRETGATRTAPAPPDPQVQCILYGPDRRLALVDRQIVHVGDRVAGGVIADIEPKAVILRRPSGELRRLEVRPPIAGAPPAAPPRSDAP